MLVVFDLDGVILDTEEIIRKSYIKAGAMPPRDFLSMEGVPWLTQQVGAKSAPFVHQQKNAEYLKEVANAKVLAPFITVAMMYARGWPMWLLTGAPRGTIDNLREYRPEILWYFDVCIDGLRTPEKMKFIEDHAINRGGVYVDDQNKFIKLPEMFEFIHYTDQDPWMLLGEIDR